MEKKVYVQLLNEGTKVYRPVPAVEINDGIYEIKGFEIYNPDDENWEFPPGSQVLVKEQNLDGEIVLVAIKERSAI
ncbi:MAG TPA: hypothetical protein PL067_06480 [Bacteroidales bacterium]|jgi:hypothetical protein|nr:hypothetical protein [Bacteroidales bacterium]HPO40351.1 hypothetical protein [Bacteroidales bacterium]